jgi:hypothetical protein
MGGLTLECDNKGVLPAEVEEELVVGFVGFVDDVRVVVGVWDRWFGCLIVGWCCDLCRTRRLTMVWVGVVGKTQRKD